MAINLLSPAFENNASIPEKHTCDGINVSPPLLIEGVPGLAQSLVLLVEDQDADQGIWSHWIVWNIDPKTTEIPENSLPLGATVGMNDFKDIGWGGPCPPTGNHQYQFKIFALDTVLHLESGSTKEQVEDAMLGHTIEHAELNGYYSRIV